MDLDNILNQVSSGNPNDLLKTVGTATGMNFSLAAIIAYLVFGTVGFVAFMRGKKNKSWRPMGIGIALMVYPYFFPGTLALYLVGLLLSAALYFWRE